MKCSARALGFKQLLAERSTRSREYLWGVELGRCVSRLSRQSGILDISQTFRHLRPLTGIDFLFLLCYYLSLSKSYLEWRLLGCYTVWLL
jgi:hypothetical protein